MCFDSITVKLLYKTSLLLLFDVYKRKDTVGIDSIYQTLNCNKVLSLLNGINYA